MVTITAWPAHGGDLAWAEKTFGRAQEEWMDLSTAMSPWVYPLPSVPESIWASLPSNDEPLITAAASYYGCDPSSIVPINGSQQAIASIPQLLETSSVAVPVIGYKEHEWAWQKAGHHVVYYQNFQQLETLIAKQQVQHVVVINPNNPTGVLWEKSQLIELCEQLAEYSNGYMIVDEAFMDIEPSHSFSSSELDNAITLRSVGKFFGLAGIRLGFVIASGRSRKLAEIVKKLRELNQPWGINHLALWAGEIALSDKPWQSQQRIKIKQQHHHLQMCIQNSAPVKYAGLEKPGKYNACGLLHTITAEKTMLYNMFIKAAHQGILFRFDAINENMAWLRIGLPTDKQLLLLQEFFNGGNENNVSNGNNGNNGNNKSNEIKSKSK